MGGWSYIGIKVGIEIFTNQDFQKIDLWLPNVSAKMAQNTYLCRVTTHILTDAREGLLKL